jgi:hypothetical protein
MGETAEVFCFFGAGALVLPGFGVFDLLFIYNILEVLEM